MIGEYRFFQDFFDGQIVKKETLAMKIFKISLFAAFTITAIVLLSLSYINWIGFALLELGMIWNLFLGLKNKFSIVLAVAVAFLYFVFTAIYGLYANALVYIACYIPFQLIASITKDYSEGDFVQIRKKMTDYNKILFVMVFGILFVALSLFDVGYGSRFVAFDGLSATLLVCSAVLRNERYLEYYIFRFVALVTSIYLWISVAIEFGATIVIPIIMMYAAYFIFDAVSVIWQHKTYINEYMIESKKYKEIENSKKVKEKLEVYKKATEENDKETEEK